MKRALVNGAGGFIGSHLVNRLKSEGFWVRGVDLKEPVYSPSPADEFITGDLRDPGVARAVVQNVDEVYQLAADMGGAGYVFTGEHDAAVMHNSAMINLNTLEAGCRAGVRTFFYSSSACMYPVCNQLEPDNPRCSEDSAYSGAPDSEYGWLKSESINRRNIHQLAALIMDIAGKTLRIRHIPGPMGVRGRNSKNRLIESRLGWRPARPLREDLEKTYAWIAGQVDAARSIASAAGPGYTASAERVHHPHDPV